MASLVFSTKYENREKSSSPGSTAGISSTSYAAGKNLIRDRDTDASSDRTPLVPRVWRRLLIGAKTTETLAEGVNFELSVHTASKSS
jgi:hypothetical protein